MGIQITVHIDTDQNDATKAYQQVIDLMSKGDLSWHSADEWYNDGEPVSADDMTRAFRDSIWSTI